ncbi:hypothetical protein C8Q79DRAFT_408501 [Trametes meyenii]|nr:hypothetical protein C8Q79DRAFT_408501 [Trametes meyenii]
MNAYAADFSDDDSRRSTTEQTASDPKGRRRSTRACDHCRRTKSKCEKPREGQSCRACAALGLSCTFTDPSHKRGPPKGYILTLERRLHQVEALLGTIIGSDDPRARSLVQDLSRDKLASHIINKVHVGPFGPGGRSSHPFSTTKEDFLASITGDLGDNASEQSGSSQDPQNDLSLLTPTSEWQDRIRNLLSASRSEGSLLATSAMSPPAEGKPRRATYPSASTGHTPAPYMQPYAMHATSPNPSNVPPFFYDYSQWAQSSAMRTSAQPTAPQAPAVMPHNNVYTNPDPYGRFQMIRPDASMPVDESGATHPAGMSDAAAQYYNTYRR